MIIYKLIKLLVFSPQITGELSEWSNELAWKASILARVSRVRISHSPHRKTQALGLAFFLNFI